MRAIRRNNDLLSSMKWSEWSKTQCKMTRHVKRNIADLLVYTLYHSSVHISFVIFRCRVMENLISSQLQICSVRDWLFGIALLHTCIITETPNWLTLHVAHWLSAHGIVIALPFDNWSHPVICIQALACSQAPIHMSCVVVYSFTISGRTWEST